MMTEVSVTFFHLVFSILQSEEGRTTSITVRKIRENVSFIFRQPGSQIMQFLWACLVGHIVKLTKYSLTHSI